MTETTARYALPFLAAGQAQKESFHNEALARLDVALHPAAQAIGVDDPPAAPRPGQCWIIGDAPTGAWADQPWRLAAWTDGGWRFVAPTIGMVVWLIGDNLPARFDAAGWTVGDVAGARLTIGGVQVVGARQPAVAEPSGGATIDVNARAALNRVIAALRTHGLID